MQVKDGQKRTKANAPRVEVTCGCGAYWRGWHAIDNTVIQVHRERERNGRQLGCKVEVAFAETPDLRLQAIRNFDPSWRERGAHD